MVDDTAPQPNALPKPFLGRIPSGDRPRMQFVGTTGLTDAEAPVSEPSIGPETAAPGLDENAPRITPTPEPRLPRALRKRSRHPIGPGEPVAPTPPKSGGLRQTVQWTLAGVIVLAILGGPAAYDSFRGTGNGFNVSLGEANDREHGYYHDRKFTSDYGPRYERDRGRSKSEWNYDGPYRYGTYGSQGMSERAKGPAADPLYEGIESDSGVFEYYVNGNVDPTGGYPVGDRSLFIDLGTEYNPYAEYSNPYLNRIRLTWGPGYGLGEAPTEP